MKDVIKFYSGEENGVVIEKNLDDSIFDRQYRKAIKLFESIVDNYDAHSSNIIAFCGDRGDGKTSAMESFVKSMKVESHYVLPVIAPSHFDEEHNILELILGQLYHLSNAGADEKLFDKLMNCFASVERCVSVLKPGKEQSYDRIAEVHELSASMDLAQYMKELFETFIAYKSQTEDEKQKKIVIVIDDMDYNWFGAYTMIKMIEKYLRNEHCVMVVSVKIEQLTELVKVGYEREIKGRSSSIELKKIAQKYINKVIPIYNRIEMPKVRDIVDSELQIWGDRVSASYIGAKPIEQFKSVKEGVVKLIFQKTRYLFYNSKGSVSLIVPTDLRSLRQLLGLLMDMPDFKKDSPKQEERDDNAENKRLFKYYFYYTWTQQMSDEDRAFADKLVDNNDTYSINKMVVNYLKRYLDERQKRAYENLLRPSNYSYNITIGDVFDMMDMIERNALDLKMRMILFFVKSFYSIMLYELYDVATEDKKNMTTLHPVTQEADDEEGPEIFKSDAWFKNTNSLQRFINGSYFTYQPRAILECFGSSITKTYSSFAMDVFCLYGGLVNEHFKKVREELAAIGPNDTYPDAIKKDCVFAEFLMLCILTSLEREIEADDTWVIIKDHAQPSYLSYFDENTAYYVFDIMAPFANLVNIKYTYDRYQSMLPDWYGFVNQHDWTLLGRLKNAINPKKGNHPESSVASDCIIRNAEVLSSVRERILSKHQLVENRVCYLNYVSKFYENLVNSEMRTYPQSRGERSVYTIKFQFLSVLSSVLQEIDTPEYNKVLTVLIDRAIIGGATGLVG